MQRKQYIDEARDQLEQAKELLAAGGQPAATVAEIHIALSTANALTAIAMLLDDMTASRGDLRVNIDGFHGQVRTL